MKLLRRQLLHLIASPVVLCAVSQAAWAQTYPVRPARIIVGFPAGGASDISARLIGQWLSERLGQPFVIENRPGAASNIGAEAAVRAAPDGYTLLYLSIVNAINATLYTRLNFDIIRDIVPVAGIGSAPSVMVVNPSVPATTVPEFIAYAKANPNKINFASAGNGSPPHVYGELFKAMTGVDMLHVPYRGSAPALTDLLGGQVQVMFESALTTTEYIRSGQLRPLAVTAAVRLEVLPEIPTMSKFLPGYEGIVWGGIGVPRNTPIEIVEKLNGEINAALADRKIRARFAELGATPMMLTSAEFSRFMAAETEKWGKVIKLSGARAD